MITKAMNKVLLVFPGLFGSLLTVTVEPFYRHSIISPHSASEVFYIGSERQILASAPVKETSGSVAATLAAPIPAPTLALAVPAAVAPAAPLAFETPTIPVIPVPQAVATAETPRATVVPVAPVAPIIAKVAQFKFSYPQYAYGYSVQDFMTGDNKIAKEVREGGAVKGSYSVADPDGTKRTVNYYADPVHGFNAVVHKTQIL